MREIETETVVKETESETQIMRGFLTLWLRVALYSSIPHAFAAMDGRAERCITDTEV